MRISYEGIGHVSVTFPVDGCNMWEVCKFDADGLIVSCYEGDAFVGIVENISPDTAAVQIHGFAEVKYTGTAPEPGYVKLYADGKGGVCMNEAGREYLVIEVDTAASTAIIEL